MSEVIVYHEFCADGEAAAWIVKRKYRDAMMIPCKAGIDININNILLDDKNIIYVDICPSKDFLETLLVKCKSVVILDHHISSYRSIESVNSEKLTKVFDNSRSGCMITWDHYNPDVARPWFIEYIGDRDLWTWRLENSKEISEGMYVMKLLNFNGFNKLFNNEVSKNTILDVGVRTITEKNKIIEKKSLKRKSVFCFKR